MSNKAYYTLYYTKHKSPKMPKKKAQIMANDDVEKIRKTREAHYNA